MIPLSIPNISEREQELVQAALAANWISTAGPEVQAFEKALRQLTGAGFVIPTQNGTSALHLALRIQGVQAGELVLAPNLTYVATVNPIYYLGAEAVLFDAKPDTWQMDPALVEAFLAEESEEKDGKRVHRKSGKRIAALVLTHVLGYAAEIKAFQRIAQQYGIPLIEDAAEAVGARYQGQHLGTFGDAGILSFNGNKIVSTGAGGALLLRDPAQAEHARSLAHQAKRHRDEYLHDEVGYNYGLSNVHAALGIGQLERLEGFLDRKKQVFARYRSALEGVGDIRFIEAAEGASPNHWLVCIQTRLARLLEEVLGVQQIQTRKLWVPMNRLPMFRDCLYVQQEDHSEAIYEASLCLPCSTNISDEDLETVIAAIQAFFSK